MKINAMDWSEKGNKIGKLDKVDTIESQTLIKTNGTVKSLLWCSNGHV